MSEESPCISIIMPCFNGGKTIADSINSVLNQGFKNFELIIIDDSSVDDSLKIIEAYSLNDSRVILLKNSILNKGVSHARNVGILKAKGRYLCFLDCDDLLTPNSLDVRYKYINKNNYSIVFGAYLRLEQNKKYTAVNPLGEIYFHDMLNRNIIGNLTGMYDSQKLPKVLQKDIRHEDYLMWCELIKISGCACSVGDEILGVYRVSSSSLSGNKLKAALWHWKVLREGLHINLVSAFKYQVSYICYSVKSRFSGFFLFDK